MNASGSVAKKGGGIKIFHSMLAVIAILVVIQQAEFLSPALGIIGQSIAPQFKKLPPTEGEFFTNVDVQEIQRDFIRMEGWVCDTEFESSAQNTFVVFRNDLDTLVFSVMRIGRADVAEAFKSNRYLYTGFRFIYPTCKVSQGQYQVGFLVESQGISKLKYTNRTITIPNVPAADCETRYKELPIDNVSLQDFYYDQVRKTIGPTPVVGYVGDPLPSPFYEIKSGEAQYCVAPTLVVVMRGEPAYDTLIGYFPYSRSLDSRENPLHGQRDQWNTLKDFNNGILLLSRKH